MANNNTLLPVTISLTRLSDGKTVEFADDLYQCLEEGYDGTFLWSYGNFSCDCNRYLFFQRALKETEKDIVNCGGTAYRVNWIKDKSGKTLYSE